jgi:O-antigen/teichoic acid export membrane protein
MNAEPAPTVRRLVRDVLVYGSGDAILRASALLTLPVYSRVLDPTDYGVWSFLVTLTFLLNAMLSLGADAAYARYFFTGELEDRRVLTSSLLLVVAAANGVAVAALLPFSGALAEAAFGGDRYETATALAILSGPLVVLSALAGQALRNRFQPVLFAALNVATAALGIVFGLWLVVAHDLGVTGVVGGTLLATLVVLPVRLWTIRDLLAPTFSRAVARRALRFGLPLVPAAFAGWALSVSDRMILGWLSTFREVGLYAVAASIASLLSFLLSPLGQAWSPHAVRAYERDPEHAREFYGRVLTYILVGFGLLGVVVTAYAPELLALLTPPEFHDARAAVAPLVLGAVAYATIQVTSAPITLKERTIWITIVSAGAAALNVLLNVALIPAYGMIAAAWSTAAASVALTLGYVAVSRKMWRVRYEHRRVLAASAAVVGFTVVASYLPDLAYELDLVLKAFYCAAFVGALFALGALDRRERAAALTALRLRSS